MNVLYLCNVNRSIPLEAGVYKKILAQCKVLREDGHDVKLACSEGFSSFVIVDLDGNIVLDIDIRNVKAYNRDNVIFPIIQKYVITNSINVIYSRYTNYSLYSYLFYKKLKQSGVDVLIEIPTFPLSQRWSSLIQNIRSRHFLVALKQFYNNTVGSLGIPLYKKCISHIVNNNGFDSIWGIPVLKISNGIDVDAIPKRSHKYIEKGYITLMTVANVAHWHGFDRLIRGLYEYYKTNPSIRVNFDIIGSGTEVKELERMTKELNVSDYVQFHGTMIGDDLDKMFEKADIGVSILGIHRNKMNVIDCLKSREFCARQLPFITQDAESHFMGKRFAYSVSSDEEPVNVYEIVDFYHSILAEEEILDEMYLFAKSECDWKYAFRNVRNYLL